MDCPTVPKSILIFLLCTILFTASQTHIQYRTGQGYAALFSTGSYKTPMNICMPKPMEECDS